MSDILNPLIQKWLGVLVRSGLTALGTYLVAKGWTDADSWAETALKLTPLLASVAWSLYEKVTAMAATEIAKGHPAGTTAAKVSADLDDTSIGQKISLAANPQ